MVTTLEVVTLVPEMTTLGSHQTVDYLGSQYIFSETSQDDDISSQDDDKM